MKKPSFLRSSIFIVFAASLFLLGLLASCSPKKEPADLVLTKGKIVTVDEARPEAQALAVRGGSIIAVGSDDDIQPYIGEVTRVIDLEGRLAIPGFIDSHGHFTGLGESKMVLDLTKASSWDDIVAMVKEAASKAQPGEWILGRGWHQEKWDKAPEPNIEGLPFHEKLSKASPDNPVLLTHASGHSCIANAKAMELGGVTNKTADPEGGEIVRDSKGRPIGVFRETAQGLVRRTLGKTRAALTAEQKKARLIKSIELAEQDCLSKGVTSFHDASSSFKTIDVFKELAQGEKLKIRLWVMVRDSNDQLKKHLAEYRIIGMGNNHLTVRAIKCFMDGALGSHGAWFLEPYTDLPTSTGLNTTPIAEITEAAELAIANGFQVCTHAIGDRANREVLNIYEKVFKEHPDKKDLRWRVEHAQHLNPADIPRFGQLGIIASMQGIHCTSDGPWVIKRLGEKRAEEGAYVWQKLMKSGAVICNGTDVPVEDVDPIPGFYALVTRKMKNGQVFFPDQRMSRKEALRAYTLNGAYAGFQEKILGSLTPGKLADITILSKDIMTVPEDEILGTKVLYTISGGKVVYEK